MRKSLALLAFVALFAACTAKPAPTSTADPTPTSAPTPDIEATVVAAVATALVAQPAAVPTWTPEPPRRQIIEVTHTTETIHYPVNGVTNAEIFASLEANGPGFGDNELDMFTVGLAVFEPLFSYTLKDNSICILDSATLDIKSTVTLPRHANIAALSGRQLDRWRQLEADTALHEQIHVDISLAKMNEFT